MSSAPNLPAKYKAVIYDKPGTISTKVEELDMPEPGPGEVVLRLTHSGVCHSDYGVMMSNWETLPYPTQAGQVGGHEGVGTIVKLGPGVEGAIDVKIGQRVGIKWVAYVCGGCPPCLAGREGVCYKQRVSGYYTPGTFQQYVLSQASYVTPIPDGLDSAAAAPLLCAGVTVYAALRKTECRAGDWVVLMGAGGGLGHLGVQIAARGIGMRVIGIDQGNKKDIIMQSGAEHFIDHTKSKSLKDDVQALTGGQGAHAVVVLTGSNAAYAVAMDLLRFAGTLVCVGMPEGEVKPIAKAFPSFMCGKETRILGNAVGSRKEAIEVLDMAARGIVKTHFRTEPMENLTKVMEEMGAQTLTGRVVLDLQ